MQRKSPNWTWEGFPPPTSPRVSPPACQESLRPSMESRSAGRTAPASRATDWGCVIGGRGKGRAALPKLSGKGGKRPPVPARKLARRVSVMESTGRGKEQTLLQRGRPALKGSSGSSLEKAEAKLGRRYSRQAGRQAERGVGR